MLPSRASPVAMITDENPKDSTHSSQVSEVEMESANVLQNCCDEPQKVLKYFLFAQTFSHNIIANAQINS